MGRKRRSPWKGWLKNPPTPKHSFYRIGGGVFSDPYAWVRAVEPKKEAHRGHQGPRFPVHGAEARGRRGWLRGMVDSARNLLRRGIRRHLLA
jgi:hypothetical protein